MLGLKLNHLNKGDTKIASYDFASATEVIQNDTAKHFKQNCR